MATNQDIQVTKVLVVEDDSLNKELELEIVESMGFCADGAEGGKKAVEMAQKETYDLIIMDIEFPDIDGIEAARLIRNIPGYKNTPMIAVTAFAMKGDRQRFLASGFNDYVEKPIDVKEFIKVLGKYKKE
ncbi:MAG: response regulator [Candidatus Methanoperedens sp.]